MSEKLLFFIGFLVFFELLQLVAPLRREYRQGTDFWKWTGHHFLLIGIGNAFIAILRLSPVLIGLYQLNTPWIIGSIDPGILRTSISILLLDFALYWQHRLIHRINFLWRFHRVHHSDTDMEVSTGFRFHPLEIIFSSFFKLLIAYLFGISLEDYLIFETVVLLGTLFSHSNFFIPDKVELILSMVIITPQIHFIHHSKEHLEMNANFGFFLSLWDRFFGSLLIYKREEVVNLELGVKNYHPKNFWDLLKDPFI